jgi:acyl-CoA reductase-like NAD-dependent aldehyde dehydrogenase
VDESQTKRVVDYIGAGSGEGGHHRGWRSRGAQASGGCYVEPTVFAGVRPEMRIAREEFSVPYWQPSRFDLMRRSALVTT